MNTEIRLFGTTFQNPILLAAGTCGFGRELRDVVDLEALGGLVTKSVTVEPRVGNPAPRLAEFGGGMINSIGLANPGLERTRREKLPWIRDNLRRALVFVSVAGHSPAEFFELVEGLDGEDGFLGFELNLSCPNDTRRDAAPFALDPDAVHSITSGARARTNRPLLAKLAPNDPAPQETARIAAESGADGLTLANTMPGLLLDEEGSARLGAGPGGVSGPALLPGGIRMVRSVRSVTSLPLVGLGGVSRVDDVLAYARAGAALVGVGTASFADPRTGERLADDLRRWGRREGISSWAEMVASARAGHEGSPEPTSNTPAERGA